MIHCGFVGILGLPNAGKSTFLNKVINEEISIVSEKPQTTRQSFSGLLTENNYQLIFFDAPGFVEKKAGLFDFLSMEFDSVIERSDCLLMLISYEQRDSALFFQALGKAKDSKKPIFYIFTKSDLVETSFIKSLKEEFKNHSEPFVSFSIKDQNKDEIKKFLKNIAEVLPKESHPLYDPDMISLNKTRDIVAEYVREQCFLELDKEIPFGLGVVIKSFKREKGLRHIEANILVEKENHKAIVIGKSGAKLKRIGQNSRKKIEGLLGEKIFLGLHVSFKKNWMKNKAIMKELGYVNESK